MSDLSVLQNLGALQSDGIWFEKSSKRLRMTNPRQHGDKMSRNTSLSQGVGNCLVLASGVLWIVGVV